MSIDVDVIRDALRRVIDPELGFSIVELGLVYTIEEVDEGKIRVEMTLTSPGCPAGAQIMGEADAMLRDVEGVEDVEIELVWEPFWTPERIDPKIRAYMGF
jgi:metal-sulfur cluster biosynthetic enzyme